MSIAVFAWQTKVCPFASRMSTAVYTNVFTLCLFTFMGVGLPCASTVNILLEKTGRWEGVCFSPSAVNRFLVATEEICSECKF